jgi:hypothetical protein
MPAFIQKHKYHLTLFLALLLATAISGGYVLATIPKKNNQTIIKTKSVKENLQLTNKIVTSTPFKPSTNTADKTEQTTTKTNKPINLFPTKINPPLAKINKQTAPTDSTQNTVSSTFYVNNEKYDFKIPPNSTVYDAMKILSQQANFKFNGKNYGNLGFLTEEINGIKNGQQNKYWIYYINGESAKVGISSYIIKPNDIITWKYENYR